MGDFAEDCYATGGNLSEDDTAALLQSLPKMAAYAVRQGNVSDDERRALLDALSHADCVPREHRDCHWEEAARLYCGNADYWRDRAERAEARLDEAYRDGREHEAYDRDGEVMELRAANERLRRELQDIDYVSGARDTPAAMRLVNEWARAALSAGADADAERCPQCDRTVDHGFLRWGKSTAACEDCDDAEPCSHESREESGGWAWCPDCRHWWPADEESDCSDHKHSRSGGRTHQCSRCGRYTFPPEPSRAEGDDLPMGMRSAVGGTSRGHGGTTTGNAEGGRPREADPQEPSYAGDASVDGGGDDGRSRAIVAAYRDFTSRRYWTQSPGGRPVMNLVDAGAVAEAAIDAALASGGAVVAEQEEHDCAAAHQLAVEIATARVRELEAALRRLNLSCPFRKAVERDTHVEWHRCGECAGCNGYRALYGGV